MERARYFRIDNQVTAIALDVIPCGFDLGSYLRIFQENGFGRLAKTVGRKLLLVDRGKQLAWEKALGIINLPTPTFIQGDICAFTVFPLPFWAHLRASTSHLIQPSLYLNEWRLSRVAIAF